MQIVDIIVPIAGIFGTGAIWQYLQFRQKQKFEESKYNNTTSPDAMYREELKNILLS